MPGATRENHTRPDDYGILSGECGCLCAAGLRLATVVARARGGRVANVSARGRPTRHQRWPRAPETAPAAQLACGQISPGPAHGFLGPALPGSTPLLVSAGVGCPSPALPGR